MCSYFFLFKQKTPYEMRISDWSSDVCSSDLGRADLLRRIDAEKARADAAEKSRRELEALVQERGVADAISFATKHTALAERIKALEEALLSATAHLVAAASAYKEHAARHRSVGRAKPDPFFTTRSEDYRKAAERAQSTARALLAEPAREDGR